MISSSHAPLRDAASSTTPMMSLSFATTKSSPSILISVPDHFPNRTRSPTLTSSGCSLPSSPRAPRPGGNDFALHRLFLGGIGDDNAACRLLFLLYTADEDAILQRSKFHGSLPNARTSRTRG